MLETSFEIPFAFDSDKNEIAPADGITGTMYTCPSCSDGLGSQSDYERKDGAQVRRHFFHRNPSDNCSQESWEHWHAKYLIHKSIVWGDDVEIVVPCNMCSGFRTLDPPKMEDAEIERALGNGRTPDVTGLCYGEPVFLVEVLHTHASEDHPGVPWVEVLATEIIENPSVWKSTRKTECESCVERKAKRKLDMDNNPMTVKSFDVYKGCWYIENDDGGLYEHYLSIGYRELRPGVLTDIPTDFSKEEP